jgi:protein phosphatase
MLSSFEHSTPRWLGAGLSDIGLHRSSNQDCYVVDDDIGLWVVADGMGGRIGGDVASGLVVKTLLDYFHNTKEIITSTLFDVGDEEISCQLRKAIQQSDKMVREKALKEPLLSGMGTTIVAAAVCSLSPLAIVIAHVGDSRAYLYRGQELRGLTRDHSLVEALVARGQISPDEAAIHPQRHILVRAVGVEGQTESDTSSHAIVGGDTLLLCSDGISKMLSERQIMDHLPIAAQSPAKACQRLISQANAEGGKDNSTAVVVYFPER